MALATVTLDSDLLFETTIALRERLTSLRKEYTAATAPGTPFSEELVRIINRQYARTSEALAAIDAAAQVAFIA